VRRVLALGSAAAAALGLAWLLGSRRRAQSPAVAVDDDPRARELRRRLDESRAVADERERFESGEVPVDRAEAPPDEVDARRRRVHEEARAVADQMRDAPSDQEG
jgi:hypothetical protein